MCNRNDCIRILNDNIHYIQEEYGVTGLTLFGSVARGDNRPDSDVDIIVEMPPKFVVLAKLNEYLESVLHTTVDLIHRHSRMNPRFLNEVFKDGIKIL